MEEHIYFLYLAINLDTSLNSSVLGNMTIDLLCLAVVISVWRNRGYRMRWVVNPQNSLSDRSKSVEVKSGLPG